MTGRARSLALTAAWAVAAVRTVRRDLPAVGLERLRLPPVPRRARSDRVVDVVLRVSRSTCFTSAAVRQAWHAAHGDPRDIVVGVTAPTPGFRAHAWLDGDPPHGDAFQELLRRPAA